MIKAQSVAFLSALLFSVHGTSAQEAKPATRSHDFIDTIGVNIHLHYTDGDYANAKSVIESLKFLGIRHVRDGVPNSATPGFGATSYEPVAKAGFTFDLIAGGTKPDLPAVMARIETFAKANPGAISAIEGPNEVNNWPVTFAGQTGDKGALAYQAALYDAVKASSLLKDVPVYNVTSWPELSGKADVANVHLYPPKGNQPRSTIEGGLKGEQKVLPGKPVALTEIGYYTLPGRGPWGGVDEETQAKLTLNLLLDAAQLGVTRTFLYQLLDAYRDPENKDFEKHFGLFGENYRPKPAATAIHNLTEILQDRGQDAARFSPGASPFTVSNLPDSGRTLTLQKSSGEFCLVIWAEPDVWNGAKNTPLPVEKRDIAVSFGKPVAAVQVFDPLQGSAPLSTQQSQETLNLPLADHPLIVTVKP